MSVCMWRDDAFGAKVEESEAIPELDRVSIFFHDRYESLLRIVPEGRSSIFDPSASQFVSKGFEINLR